MKKKKGLALDTFVRIIIVVIALWAVFTIAKKVAEAAGIGASDIEPQFTRLVNEINSLKTGDVSHIFVNLDVNTAIIGFAKNSLSYGCYYCGTPGRELSSFIIKPNVEACNGKACLCLCRNGLQRTTLVSPYDLGCERMLCKSLNLNEDLAGTIELKQYIEDLNKKEQGKYNGLLQVRWEGGFLLERHQRDDFISNGLPAPQFRRFTIYADKQQRGDVIWTTICPGQNCESKYESTEKDIPRYICYNIEKCVAELKAKTFGSERECSLQNVKRRFLYEEDCKKAEKCIKSMFSNLGSLCSSQGSNFALTITSAPAFT